MKFLGKKKGSSIVADGIRYNSKSGNEELRTRLIKEQSGFCAYTEKYIEPLDSVDVDHFDPRKKDTPEDGYTNWYAVLHKQNQKRPRKTESHLPLPNPAHPQMTGTIEFLAGQFVPVDEKDVETRNLIKWLGLDSFALLKQIQNHLSRIKFLRAQKQEEEFLKYLNEHPRELSFISALEKEFNLKLANLIPNPEI